MIFGEYDEVLDKQEQEKYLREETEAARSEGKLEGKQEGIKIGERNGTKQKTVQMVKTTMKRFPEWSDQEVADFVKDISAEEVAELRKGKEIHSDN